MGAIHQALLCATAAGGGSAPTFPTFADIWEWWEPSRNGFVADQFIGTMAGQVAPGAGHDFTQTGADSLKPIYKENIVNGVGVARFDGSTESLANVNPSALTAAHLWMVINVVAEQTATGVWQFGTSASTDHYAFTDGNIYDGACSTTRRNVGNPVPSLQAWRVVEVVSVSGEWTYKLDGTQLFTTATNTVALNTNCKLGVWGTLEKACDIAGVYLFSAKLSAGDRTLMVNYLNSRFGLSIS